MVKITDKQDQFCREYVVDFNATQAAIRAGYSQKSANRIASRLLSKAHIQSRLTTLKGKRANKANVTAEYVISSLNKVADRCMQAEPVLDKLGNPTGEYRFEHSGANKALELLGKHLGLYIERHQEVPNDLVVEVQWRAPVGGDE